MVKLHSADELLEKQHNFYLQILTLMQEEKGKFERDRPLSEITPLIKQVRVLFQCIEEIAEELKELTQKDPLAIRRMGEIQSTLKQILVLDKENQKFMKQYLSALKRKSPPTKRP